MFAAVVGFVPVQTQRQLQHSLEVHQRYITSLMEQEGLAHRIPEMSAALAKGPTGPAAAAAVPGSVVSEAMPAQHAADSMQHQQLGYHNHNGTSSSRAAAAPVVHPSLPQYHPSGSNGIHLGNLQQQHHQQQQHALGMQQHVGHSRTDRNPGHMQQQQHHGMEDFLIPGDLVPHPQQHGSMGMQHTSAAAAAAAAAAAEHGGDLLGMTGMSGPSGDMFLLDHDHHDHDLHFMLAGMPGEEDLGQGHPDKRQRLLGPDDL
jgi:hypothetical protein